MAVYKIFIPQQWQQFQAAGRFDGSPDDLRDGFIHLSTADQLAGTIAKHFAGDGALVIVACDETVMAGDLRWEVSRGGNKFPHLYRALVTTDVVDHAAFHPSGEAGRDAREIAEMTNRLGARAPMEQR